jgi:hypothetical protein
LRFRNVAVDRRDTITDAYIEFTVDEYGGEGDLTLLVWGELAGSARKWGRWAMPSYRIPTETEMVVTLKDTEWRNTGEKVRLYGVKGIIQVGNDA